MSATNRSEVRKEHKFDHYVTPKWIIKGYLDAVESRPLLLAQHLAAAKHGILDCCAGGLNPELTPKDEDWDTATQGPRHIFHPPKSALESVEMPYPDEILGSAFSDCPISTCDIRVDSKADIIGDFLKMEREDIGTPGYIITNPPFNLAQEIVQKALGIVRDDGIVVMLLRIGFLGSAKRFPWFREHMPEFIFLSHKRPSFTPDGKTDSDYYGHMVWRKNCRPTESRMIII